MKLNAPSDTFYFSIRCLLPLALMLGTWLASGASDACPQERNPRTLSTKHIWFTDGSAVVRADRQREFEGHLQTIRIRIAGQSDVSGRAIPSLRCARNDESRPIRSRTHGGSGPGDLVGLRVVRSSASACEGARCRGLH